jgi:hypothetical protein
LGDLNSKELFNLQKLKLSIQECKSLFFREMALLSLEVKSMLSIPFDFWLQNQDEVNAYNSF